jgi:threonine/homoserine/homoserine lactone efflux protein
MSDLRSLAAFALTSLIIEVTPGPNMAYLATLSLQHGIRVGLAAVAGVACGLMIYGIAAAFGVAAIIDNSAVLYETLRWAGVLFLLWLAWQGWIGEGETSPGAPGETDAAPWRAFRRGLITNLLNPKAAIFYIAILPDFVTLAAGRVALQTLTLSVIYVSIATLIHSLIVVMAGSLQSFIVDETSRRRLRRVLSMLLGAIAIWFAWTTARTA